MVGEEAGGQVSGLVARQELLGTGGIRPAGWLILGPGPWQGIHRAFGSSGRAGWPGEEAVYEESRSLVWLCERCHNCRAVNFSMTVSSPPQRGHGRGDAACVATGGVTWAASAASKARHCAARWVRQRLAIHPKWGIRTQPLR